MPRIAKIAGSAIVGLMVGGLASGAIAVASHPQTDHGHAAERAMMPLNQPLAIRVGVTLVGAGLMAAELWWFLGQRDN